MQLEIITPDKKIFKGEVKSVQLPGIGGSFGVLDNHAPLISALKKGTINIKGGEAGDQSFEVNGGVIEVLKNKVIILAD